jgi:hypothetical protein
MAVFFLISTWHQSAEVRHVGILDGPGDNESYEDKIARYRAGAENAARIACTNEIVGLRGIIALDVQTYDNNFKNWTANATVEYINHIGSVDRTNIELTFDPGYSGVPTWFKKTD